MSVFTKIITNRPTGNRHVDHFAQSPNFTAKTEVTPIFDTPTVAMHDLDRVHEAIHQLKKAVQP